jgi:hypothetical protein
MQTLQSRAEELKEEQLKLKQLINEKNTANILVGLFSKSEVEQAKTETDPEVEELLQRPSEEIPDATKISELPSLILPGHHASKKLKACAIEKQDLNDDGIDYDLLSKDRSQCSPEELDRIRRERNRMHAKRTRDRKRLFMEEMAEVCRILEDENDLLRSHLALIDPEYGEMILKQAERVNPEAELSSCSTPTLLSPNFVPLAPKVEMDDVSEHPSIVPSKKKGASKALPSAGVMYDQITTLLEAATSFERPSKRSNDDAFTAVSSDDSHSDDCHSADDHHHEDFSSSPVERSFTKRMRVEQQQRQQHFSKSSSPPTATVGC